MLMTKRPEIADESWEVDANAFIFKRMDGYRRLLGRLTKTLRESRREGCPQKDVKNEGRPDYIYENNGIGDKLSCINTAQIHRNARLEWVLQKFSRRFDRICTPWAPNSPFGTTLLNPRPWHENLAQSVNPWGMHPHHASGSVSRPASRDGLACGSLHTDLGTSARLSSRESSAKIDVPCGWIV
jgi:hypothetical protein